MRLLPAGGDGGRGAPRARGGLLLGFRVGTPDAGASEGAPAVGPFRPNAYARLDPDGRVTLVVDKTEMGQGVRTQNGRVRFGRDPRTSALDPLCRAHEVDLYVVDGSFFPSSSAVNPALTIMTNALRVGDHLAARPGQEVPAG